MRAYLSMAARSVVLVTVVAAAPPAWSADASYDFTVCVNTKITMLEARADLTALGVETWGIVATSTTKEMENATQHCLGTLRIVEGKQFGKGLCKWTDPAGNTFVGEWELTGAVEGAWVFLGGTGKYKGVKGAGRFQDVGRGKPIVEGTAQSCRRDRGTYTLPSAPG